MSQNENNQNSSGPNISWGKKLGYVGTGVVIGIVIYPFVKKTIAKVQPKLDQWLDDLTGKAEGFAEKASDLVATAREKFKGSFDAETKNGGNGHDHKHDHDHDHDHNEKGAAAKKKPAKKAAKAEKPAAKAKAEKSAAKKKPAKKK